MPHWQNNAPATVIDRPQISRLRNSRGASASPRWKRFLESRSPLTPQARLRLLKRLCPTEISRDKLREAFLADEALLNEFINELTRSAEGMNLVMAHDQFLRRLYSEEFTSQLVRQNPDMREMMIQNMIAIMQQDTSTYNEMNEMMEEFHESMGEMR